MAFHAVETFKHMLEMINIDEGRVDFVPPEVLFDNSLHVLPPTFLRICELTKQPITIFPGDFSDYWTLQQAFDFKIFLDELPFKKCWFYYGLLISVGNALLKGVEAVALGGQEQQELWALCIHIRHFRRTIFDRHLESAPLPPFFKKVWKALMEVNVYLDFPVHVNNYVFPESATLMACGVFNLDLNSMRLLTKRSCKARKAQQQAINVTVLQKYLGYL